MSRFGTGDPPRLSSVPAVAPGWCPLAFDPATGARKVQMLAGRPHIEPKRTKNADTVVVKEIYLSLQGESSHVGRLCAFIRLTGCHLRCTYCDSAFAFNGGRRWQNAEVVARVRQLGASMVEITGGEP